MKVKLLAMVLHTIVWLLKLTLRFKFINPEELKKAKSVYVFGSWHQNSFSGVLSQVGKVHQLLISQSKDGSLMEYTCRKLGYLGVRGSSTRGGKEARLKLRENIALGIPAAITVDGPRGPAYQVKPGIIDLAKSTHVPIVGITAIPSRFWCFQKSWDKFRLPKPFSTVYVKYAEPLLVPENISDEEFSLYQEKLKVLLDNDQKFVMENYL